jgi:glutamate racemase
MKIGIFDSGVGGLLIAKAIQKRMPKYDYVYLGDTKRVPYGNRSPETVFEFTEEAVNHLFEKENCRIVILACNTASARALKKLQKKFDKEGNKKVLGVLIPAAEEGAKFERVGVLATAGTVASETFVEEIKKRNNSVKVFQNAAPMLVPLAEAGEKSMAHEFIKKYLTPLQAKKIDALILGCTHYPIFKNEIKKLLSKNVRIISQDEIVPKRLEDYLKRHTEISQKLSLGHSRTGEAKKGSVKILVTDTTQNIQKLTREWFGKEKPKFIDLG